MKTVIHVNRHIIDSNRKNGELEPPLIARTYKTRLNAHSIDIKGPSRIVYSPNKPLAGCGARVWIETDSEVLVIK